MVSLKWVGDLLHKVLGVFTSDKAKADLQRWTTMLASGQLSKDDFEWLLQSKKDLAELVALKQAGLAQVALDRFVNGLLNVVVTSAFKVFA